MNWLPFSQASLPHLRLGYILLRGQSGRSWGAYLLTTQAHSILEGQPLKADNKGPIAKDNIHTVY